MSPEPSSSPTPPRRGRRLLRRGFQGAGLLLLAAAIVFGVVWFQERPLADAEAALLRGDPDLALRLTTYFLVNNPQHKGALTLKARALVKMGRAPEEVVQIFEHAGAERKEDIHAWARAYLMLQQWSLAEPLLTRVLQLAPRDADALYEITTCRIRLRQFQESLQTAQKFLVTSKASARGNLLVGSIQYDLGNQDKAAAHFAKVIEQEPNAENLQVAPGEFFLQYGRTLLQAGRPQESLHFLGRAILLNPSAEGYTLLGNAAQQVAEMKNAVELWASATKVDSDYLPAREALARAALDDGDTEKAIEWLKPVLGGETLQISTTYLMQRIHLRRGDHDTAKL